MSHDPLSSAVRNLCRSLRMPEALGLPDAQLLEAFVTGQDEVAFEALVRRHGPTVLGVCRRVLGNHHDAEDAFQATFLILARKAGSVRPGGMVGNWLCGVAYRTASKARGQRAGRQAREQAVAARDRSSASGDLDTPRDELALLDDALHRLPDRYRVPLILCELQGHSRPEAARLLGIPEGTLSSRLARGRDRLRRALLRRGITVLAGAALATPATVPAALVEATLRARLAVVTGTELPSAAVATTLTKKVLHTMLMQQILKAVTLAVVFLGLVGTGVGLLVQAGPFSSPQASAPAPRPPAPAPRPGQGDNKAPPADVRRELPLRDAGIQEVGALAFTTDGRKVLVGSVHQKGETVRGVLTVWDRASGRRLAAPQKLPDGLAPFGFSPDGRFLMLSDSQLKLTLWDLKANRLAAPLRNLPDFPGTWLFSPDGKTFATTSAVFSTPEVISELIIWDVATGRRRARLDGSGKPSGKPFLDAAFTPDSKTLAALQNDFPKARVLLLDPDTGKERARLEVSTKAFRITLSPDGKSLAVWGGEQNELELWDVAGRKRIAALKGHRNHVRTLTWFPASDRLATVDLDGKIKVWDRGGKELASFELPGVKGPAFIDITITRDGKNLLLSGPSGGPVFGVGDGTWTTRILDAKTGKQVRTLKDVSPFSPVMSPDGRVAAVIHRKPAPRPAVPPPLFGGDFKRELHSDTVSLVPLTELLTPEAEKKKKPIPGQGQEQGERKPPSE